MTETCTAPASRTPSAAHAFAPLPRGREAGPPPVSEDERQRRAELVRLARRAIALEGWRTSDATRAAQDAYVAGEIELDELASRTQTESGAGVPLW